MVSILNFDLFNFIHKKCFEFVFYLFHSSFFVCLLICVYSTQRKRERSLSKLLFCRIVVCLLNVEKSNFCCCWVVYEERKKNRYHHHSSVLCNNQLGKKQLVYLCVVVVVVCSIQIVVKTWKKSNISVSLVFGIFHFFFVFDSSL